MGVVLLVLAGAFGVLALYCYDLSWEMQGWEEWHLVDVWTYRAWAVLALAAAILFGGAYQQMAMERTILKLTEDTEAMARR